MDWDNMIKIRYRNDHRYWSDTSIINETRLQSKVTMETHFYHLSQLAGKQKYMRNATSKSKCKGTIEYKVLCQLTDIWNMWHLIVAHFRMLENLPQL